MTQADPGVWTTLADVVAAACLLLGAYFSLSAGVGVLRFGNLLARTHAVAKPQVLGLILLLIGVALRVRSWPTVTMLALVVAFQLLTSPVSAHMVGRAGVRTGKVDPADLEVDELGGDEAEPRRLPEEPTAPR
ncbi:monovalent cation/H(+) antiporter subunit G [Puerhibacterium puerhi]|uniref:monovalent cation/H(+) antiporter subunit G n=1 Tax=Puerhibacterium puerhi TaxID=2692623 RepID=UPI001358A40F|nr:monovalent cation/H(+) antiporter subunit G [Puerhibacterium puerhi]